MRAKWLRIYSIRDDMGRELHWTTSRRKALQWADVRTNGTGRLENATLPLRVCLLHVKATYP